MRAMGVIMLPSTALRQSSSAKSLKSPGGGPPALLMRMSGSGQAASSALRPASVVTAHTTGVTFTPVGPSSLAVAWSASAPRAQIVTLTPSRASAWAQPLPNPFDAAQTMAFLPLMPRSMVFPHALKCSMLRHAGCPAQPPRSSRDDWGDWGSDPLSPDLSFFHERSGKGSDPLSLNPFTYAAH